MKKIIVPTGYMGSGSSAITDLISEFKDCQNEFKTYEYVLLHCPNGLFDLEDKLLIGNNAIRSDEAIRSFENQMQKLYNKKFWWVGNYQKIISPDFMKITKEYINKIQEFNFPGYWYTHEEVNAKMFFKLLIRKPLKILTMNKVRFNKILKYSDGMRISYVDSKKFYTVSQELFVWIKENKDKKWMSYVHIDDAHFPENFFTYDTKDLKLIEEDFKRINTYLNNIPKGYKGSISYDLSLMYCDNIIKNIFKFLEKEKILNDTSIVITADHGFSYYFSPVREKYVISSYRENYNVPFIVWSKDIKNKMINNYCSTKDIPATLLDLVDIKIPKVFKGQSLLESKGQDYALLEYMGGGCPDIYRRPIILGVRTDNYDVVMEVYINKKFIDNEIKEVYNIRKDPFEYDNLFKQENIKEKIKKELQILENRYNEIISQYEVK